MARSSYSLESGQAAAARLLKAGVTGIVCASDPLALGAIRAVRRAGLDVPRDVSVVGFDDSALMNATDPPLTTVRQPIDPMGRAAIEMLVSGIRGVAVPQDELLFEPELVVRGSTGPAPASSGATSRFSGPPPRALGAPGAASARLAAARGRPARRRPGPAAHTPKVTFLHRSFVFLRWTVDRFSVAVAQQA